MGKYGTHDLVEPVRREIVIASAQRDGDGLHIAVHTLVRTLCKGRLMEDAGVRIQDLFTRSPVTEAGPS